MIARAAIVSLATSKNSYLRMNSENKNRIGNKGSQENDDKVYHPDG